MNGFSLSEILIVLLLISFASIITFTGLAQVYEAHEVKAFEAQLTSAIKLAQGFSLMRKEDLIICAEVQNNCQENWQGNVVLRSDNELIKSFGDTPKLNISYNAFYRKDQLLIQNHGLLINNGTFNIKGNSQKTYFFTINKEGIINTP